MTALPRASVSAPPAGAVSTTPAVAVTTHTGLHSAIYTGWVRHRRHAPKALAFRYPLFLMYLDLGELDQVFTRRWLWSVGRRNLAEFRRSDYLGDPAQPLDEAVRDRVQQHTGERPLGSVRMLTHLRYFGHCFNPVTFYYCHDAQQRLHSIVAEITNTPWRQLPYLRAAADPSASPRQRACLALRQTLPRLAVHGDGAHLCLALQ